MSRTIIDQTLRENQISYDDSNYYLPKGSKNSHRLIESRGQNQKASEDLTNPLFQFEMKFDSLKNYVDSVTTAVNQHASLLNKLRSEINLRVVEKNLSETINKFADCIAVKDIDPSFMITAVNENIESKEEEGSFQNSVTNFCNKLEIFGSGFSKVNKIGQTINGRMQEIENNMAKKVCSAEVKEKVKKVKTKLQGEIENNNKKLDEKIKQVEKRWLEKYESLERRFNRQEQNRNEEDRDQLVGNVLKKVDLSNITKDLEEKIIEEMNRVIAKSNQLKQQETAELQLRIQTIDESTNKQMLDVRKTIEELSTSLVKKSESSKKDDLEKEIQKHLALGMKTFGQPFEESCRELKQQVEELRKSLENRDKTDDNHESNKLYSQKMVEVEQVVEKSNQEIEKLNEKINEIVYSLKEKTGQIEIDTLSRSKTEKDMGNFTEFSGFVQAEEEKHKRISKTIEDLEQKVDKVNQNFDRKAAKLKKEFDLDSLIKQFKSKADEGYVQKNFENFEAKIAGLSDTFSLLKREMDMITKSNYHSSKPNDNAFISIKSALPKSCLSCGNAPIHQVNNSFIAKKPERMQLREKELSVDRPSTANNFKMKGITGSNMTQNMNLTSTQGFGITPLRISATRQGEFR